MSALFFLAFAYFAVGQAAVTRNSAQTAADAAAMAAARDSRDQVKDAFLHALTGGDLPALGNLLTNGGTDVNTACTAAGAYANENQAKVLGCDQVYNPPGFTVLVRTLGTVGRSVVPGTENTHAEATATAVVEPRCQPGGKGAGHVIRFTCNNADDLTIDPSAAGFRLDLSAFYSVHLSK